MSGVANTHPKKIMWNQIQIRNNGHESKFSNRKQKISEHNTSSTYVLIVTTGIYLKNRLTLSHCLQILLDLICEQVAKKNKKISFTRNSVLWLFAGEC